MHKTENELNFYSNLESFAFSFSSLSMLISKPMDFYNKYVLGKEQEDTIYTIAGRLFHCMLLEPHLVSEKFKVLKTSMPEGEQKKCIDMIISLHLNKPKSFKASLNDYQEELLQYMKLINYYQHLKLDSARLEKIITPSAVEYFIENTSDLGKTCVDINTYISIQDKVTALHKDDLFLKLIALEKEEGWESQNEVEINIDKNDLPGFNFGLKGVLDKIIFNNTLKIVHIIDAKTTSSTLKEFHDKAELYNYPMQGAIYRYLIKSLIGEKANEYQINVYFATVDKGNNSYTFELTEEKINKQEELFISYIKKQGKADYHFNNENFRLPYEYLVYNVKL